MKVLLLLSFVALAAAKLECGENSYYDDCASECPLTCDNYKNPPQVCILQCSPICYCDDGYVKTKDGKCVKPEDCPIKPKPVGKNCDDAPDRGNCKSYIPTFYYDAKLKACRVFLYGGCGGNGNKYDSYGECMDRCGGKATIEAGQRVTCTKEEFQCKAGAVHCIPKAWRCDLKKDCMDGSDEEGCENEKTCEEQLETGLCEAYIPSWYYDAKTGTCKRFIYGGCGGNGNRYESNEACLNNCKGTELKHSDSGSERCHLPPEVGHCYAYIIRYYFDKAARECKGFVYGGCGGNENNFKTSEECKMACK